MNMPAYAVVGIGNVTLSDDAVGPIVVRAASERLAGRYGAVEFAETYSGGFDLLDLVTGKKRCLVVDSIVTGRVVPGTCHEFGMDDLRCFRDAMAVQTHTLDLVTVMELGAKYGYELPSELRLWGIEAADVSTFSECLTPAVADSVGGLVDKVAELLGSWHAADGPRTGETNIEPATTQV